MRDLFYFILGNLFIIILFLLLAYEIKRKRHKHETKKDLTFIEFLNGSKKLKLKTVIIGLVFGIVFGFLDNFGLWIGLSKLQKYFPGGVKTKSALGNTYSDFIGATIGTTISMIAVDLFNFSDDDVPIWVNTLGIIIGCILGLFFGVLVTGKT